METFLNPAQTAADLRNAADILAMSEWTQGYDFNGKGAMCAFGAIRRAVGDDLPPRSTQTRDRASNAARAFYRFFSEDIVTYNDADGRTQAQMVRALETVAAAVQEDPRRA